EALAQQMLSQARGPPSGGAHQRRDAFGEDAPSTPADAADEAPCVQMKDDPVATAGQVGNRPVVPAMDAFGAPLAERALRCPPRGRGRHMNRRSLPPHAVNTHSRHLRKEEFGQHGYTGLSPEMMRLWSLSLPPSSVHQKCRRANLTAKSTGITYVPQGIG